MMAKIFISGSISLKTLDIQAVTHLDSIIAHRNTVLIGDAHGIDKAVQQYLSGHNYQSVIVYYSGDKIRNNIGHWETKQTGNDSHLTGKRLYQLKDDAMAHDADRGLMIWNGKSRGTEYNMENMTKLDKPFTVLNCMTIPQDVFTRYAALGKQMDKRRVLSLLTDMYMDCCGISLTFRTVVYDFGWAVFRQYVENEKTEFSGDEPFCTVMGQINPAYTEEYDEYDVWYIEDEEYPAYCAEILEEYSHDSEKCAALCYGFMCRIKEAASFLYKRQRDSDSR